MLTCNHYIVKDGFYENLIQKVGEYWMCKQCSRTMTESEYHTLDTYCSRMTTVTQDPDSPLSKIIEETELSVLSLMLPAPQPYEVPEKDPVDERVNPFFYKKE